jgi:hypothetical protein
MVEAIDLSNLSEQKKRQIAEEAAKEQTSGRNVITAFVVTLETNGTWKIGVDLSEKVIPLRQLVGDDLIAASAVISKDVYVSEIAQAVPQVLNQVVQGQMQQQQAQKLAQGLGLR